MSFSKIKFRLSNGKMVSFYVIYRSDLRKFEENMWQVRNYIHYALSRIQRRYYPVDEYNRICKLLPVLSTMTEMEVVILAKATEKLMAEAWLIRVIPKRGMTEWHKLRYLKILLSEKIPKEIYKGIDGLMEMALKVKTAERYDHIVRRRQVWESEYNTYSW